MLVELILTNFDPTFDDGPDGNLMTWDVRKIDGWFLWRIIEQEISWKNS